MKDWKKVKLGTLLTESKIVSEKPSTDKRLRVKLNVLGIEKRPVTKDKKGATKYYTRKEGQFVYGKQNLHKGAFGIVPKELDGFESSSDIPAFDIDDSCYPEWIFYFFRKGDFYLKLETLAKGVGSKRIHPKQIYELEIFLPSKKEQRKVLDEIEKAEAHNQELVNEILSQEENLTKLRKSILQDAVQGNLTKEWRVQSPTLEPASELLKKIKAEKEQLIKEKKLKKTRESGEIKENEFEEVYPKSWCVAKLVDLCFITKLAGFEYSKHINLHDVGDVPTIRAQNVKPNRIDETNLKYIDLETSKLLHRCALTKPAILMTFIGAGIGDTAIFNKKERWHLAPNVAKLEPFNEFEEKIIIEYLQYYLMSNTGRKQIFKHIKATAQPSLSMGTIRDGIVIIPPYEEQKSIVEKVNRLFAHCDVLEKEIKTSKTNTEKLMQSVLSELLGEENNILENKRTSKKEIKKPSREIIYNSKTLLMDLVKLLKENGKLHAEDLWKMSKFPNDINAFYAELKKQIEEEKAIKEVVNEKGYLELA